MYWYTDDYSNVKYYDILLELKFFFLLILNKTFLWALGTMPNGEVSPSLPSTQLPPGRGKVCPLGLEPMVTPSGYKLFKSSLSTRL